MNDQVYMNREAQMQAEQERQTMMIMLLALGLAIGAIITLLVVSKARPKPKPTFRDRLDEGLDTGREATAKALKQLEKEFAELRKKVEERVSEIR